MLVLGAPIHPAGTFPRRRRKEGLRFPPGKSCTETETAGSAAQPALANPSFPRQTGARGEAPGMAPALRSAEGARRTDGARHGSRGISRTTGTSKCFPPSSHEARNPGRGDGIDFDNAFRCRIGGRKHMKKPPCGGFRMTSQRCRLSRCAPPAPACLRDAWRPRSAWPSRPRRGWRSAPSCRRWARG